MYTVTVSRVCPAKHYLTVPNPEEEGEIHRHEYRAEVQLLGESLGEYGYLVDIDDVETALDTLTGRYQGGILNDLPEFEGNPSVERFARCFCKRLLDQLDLPNVDRIRVTMWEDETAAGGFEQPV